MTSTLSSMVSLIFLLVLVVPIVPALTSHIACGVCGSDVHSITGGWGETPLPLCVGHEVVGRAIRVGDKVKVRIP